MKISNIIILLSLSSFSTVIFNLKNINCQETWATLPMRCHGETGEQELDRGKFGRERQ